MVPAPGRSAARERASPSRRKRRRLGRRIAWIGLPAACRYSCRYLASCSSPTRCRPDLRRCRSAFGDRRRRSRQAAKSGHRSSCQAGNLLTRMPHSSTIGLLATRSWNPYVVVPVHRTAQGPGRPPPLNGEPGYGEPSARSSVTLPPCAPLSARHDGREIVGCSLHALSLQANAHVDEMCHAEQARAETIGDPHVSAASIASPLLLIPVLKFWTWLGWAAGNASRDPSPPFDTQMRFCWSMAEMERRAERFARLLCGALADDRPFV